MSIEHELKQEWGEKEAFPQPEEGFKDGFTRRAVLGALFLAFILLPGSIYSGLFMGQGLGTAAQWVTIILFTEVTRRAFTFLTRQEIYVIYALAGSLVVGGGPFFGLIWNQFIIQSPQANAFGIAQELSRPENAWIVPPIGSEALLNRTLWHRDWWWNPHTGWKSPIIVLLLSQVLGWLNHFGLGYVMFRVTSDIERLPFPLAPIAAQGATALAESYENREGWRWRVFSIGAAIGCLFGLVYVFLPGFTGAVMNRAVDPFTKPFWDWSPFFEYWTPAALVGLVPHLGLVFTGFVLPFRLVLGGACASVLFHIILNPLLYQHSYLTQWKPGMGTLRTQFANNMDLWLAFGIGAGLAVACIGLGTLLRGAVGRRKVMRFAWLPASALGPPLLILSGWGLAALRLKEGIALSDYAQFGPMMGTCIVGTGMMIAGGFALPRRKAEERERALQFDRWTAMAGAASLICFGMAMHDVAGFSRDGFAMEPLARPVLAVGVVVAIFALAKGLHAFYQQTFVHDVAAPSPRPPAGVNLGPGKHRGDIPVALALGLWALGTAGLCWLCHALVPTFPWKMFLFYGFVWTPLNSYITARMVGLAGQGFGLPYFKEGSFVMATKHFDYKGVDVWFAPIPLADTGWTAQFYREALLTRTKISSLIKAQLLVFPLLIFCSILFCSMLWRMAQIPSAAYPDAAKMWPQNALYFSLWLTATQTGESYIVDAITPDRIWLGLGTGMGLYALFSVLKLPMLFFWGFIGGVSALPHGTIPVLIGGCIGRWYFAKKLGREVWHAYAPVLAAGFASGIGLVIMLNVGFVMIVKSVVQAPY